MRRLTEFPQIWLIQDITPTCVHGYATCPGCGEVFVDDLLNHWVVQCPSNFHHGVEAPELSRHWTLAEAQSAANGVVPQPDHVVRQ